MNLDLDHISPVVEPDSDAAPESASAVALGRLAAGNARLAAAIEAAEDPRAALSAFARADPYAVILGCSDSRVPPEIVFDETVGQLFVVRVASGVAGSNEIGSIEYALARWGCPVLVVLGHTQCGGIAAALDKLPPGAEPPPDARGSMHLGSLLSGIRSALGPTAAISASQDPWRAAAEQNVRRTVELLLNWSEPIRRRVTEGRLAVVGAVYDVESAQVEFLAG